MRRRNYCRNFLRIASFGILLIGSVAHAQTVSRFDFNSTATLTTATSGPNGTAISAVAVAPAGIAYITAGCGAGVGMDMVVPGGTFDLDNITIRARFRRGSTEFTGNFFERGDFFFGFVGSRLRARYRVSNGGSGSFQRTLNTSHLVGTTDYHEYEFRYDNCTGDATILVDGVAVGSRNEGADTPLFWTGAGDALIGSELDNACVSYPGLDWIHIGGNNTGCIEPLPIEWGAFSGRMQEEGAEIRWTTISETNNDYFDLERSADGIAFEQIGRVAGAGNSTQLVSYRFTDAAPFDGKTFYRLKQTDFDGAFSYSQVIAVATTEITGSIRIGPVPAEGNLQLEMRGKKAETYTLLVQDMRGKTVHRQSVDNRAGHVQLSLSLAHLEAGVYLLRLIANGEQYHQKIILQ